LLKVVLDSTGLAGLGEVLADKEHERRFRTTSEYGCEDVLVAAPHGRKGLIHLEFVDPTFFG